MKDWTEGARSRDPLDSCPRGHAAPMLVVDFKKMGKHRMTACEDCAFVYLGDEPFYPIVMHPQATTEGSSGV